MIPYVTCEPDSAGGGAWNCQGCRQIPQIVMDLKMDIHKLKQDLHCLNQNNIDLVSQLAAKTATIETLRTEIGQLQQYISQAGPEINSTQNQDKVTTSTSAVWGETEKSNKILLIGDSIIRGAPGSQYTIKVMSMKH